MWVKLWNVNTAVFIYAVAKFLYIAITAVVPWLLVEHVFCYCMESSVVLSCL